MRDSAGRSMAGAFGAGLAGDRFAVPLARVGVLALRVAAVAFPLLFMVFAATSYTIFGDPRGRLGVAGFLVAGVVIAMASLVGAGLASHVDYVGALRSTANGAPTPLSLPGLLAAAGAPPALVSLSLPLLVAASVAGAVLLRRHERRSFALLAVGAALATPVVYFQTIALLAVALVPWLFPAQGRAPDSRMAAHRGP